jgi:hypothetical protein
VIVQPILEGGVRYADVEGFVVVPDELGWFEPRIVALRIDFLFNDIENLLPSIHGDHNNEKGRISTGISTCVEKPAI